MFTKMTKAVLVMVMLALMLGSSSLLLWAAEDSGATTKLEPGQQHWYTLAYPGSGMVEVHMDVDPAGSAGFMIATSDAVRAWGSGAELAATGRGANNPNVEADLSWSGSFGQTGDYHLIVEYSGNGQDPAFYSLDVSGAEISADSAASEEDVAAAGEEAPAAAADAAADAAVGAEVNAEAEKAAASKVQPEASSLATAKAVARLSNQPGRAIVTARGNHFVVDSVPPIGGPNEEINPLDLILGAQATCAAFVYETAAQEMGFPLTDIVATVEADFNPAGVKDGSVNPRIQAMRVHMDLTGASDEQAAELAEQFMTRCPMYTTLIRSTPITITAGEKPETSVGEGLATATAVARLSNQPGRAIVSARGNHFVVDSVPPLGGPNEERNPLDLALGALATCGTFLYEAAAQELDIPLTDIVATVEADFGPAGVKDGSVNPRIQAFRMKMELAGATAEQAELLTEEYTTRCPIYTTLVRSAPIEIEVVTE